MDIYPYYFNIYKMDQYNLQNFDLNRFIAKNERICDKIRVLKFTRLSDYKFSDNDNLFYDVSVHENVGQYYLNIGVSIRLKLLCYRCLENVDFEVKTSNHYKLVQVTNVSAKHVIDDIQIEITDDFDLLSFIEDEVLLELPPSPKHAYKCN